MRAANLEGKVFGKLTVIKRLGVIKQGKKSQVSRVLWLCQCECGNYVEVTTNDLTSGKRTSCGCSKIDNGKLKRKTNVGDIYNFLRVEELVGKNKDGRLLYRCTCLRCGNECTVSGKNLRNGTTQSCGCLKEEYMEHFGDTNFRDLSGQVFDYLLVEDRAPTRYSARGNQTTMWNCICLLCGKRTIVASNCLTVEDNTRSCGCLRMSNGELEIDNELKRLNINYIYDYSFPDLISPNSEMPLRFDFALFDNYNNLLSLIEFQGPQHYQKYNDGFGDFQREVTDPMKKEYCKRNDINLYEIKYNEEVIPALNKILNITYHTSHDNPVPSSVKEKV